MSRLIQAQSTSVSGSHFKDAFYLKLIEITIPDALDGKPP